MKTIVRGGYDSGQSTVGVADFPVKEGPVAPILKQLCMFNPFIVYAYCINTRKYRLRIPFIHLTTVEIPSAKA